MDAILNQAPLFVLAFLRVGALFLATPFFNSNQFSAQIKVGFAFFITLLLFPSLPVASWPPVTTLFGLLAMAVGELVVGLMIGMMVLILLSAVELAGYLAGFQMSFTMAMAFDPNFGEQTNILSSFLSTFALLVFLGVGGDHSVLRVLADSFTRLPPGGLAFRREGLDLIAAWLTSAFNLGVRLSAPVVVVLLIVDVVIGVIGKMASKIQIFFVAIPLKVSLGLFLFSGMLGFIVTVWGREVGRLPDLMVRLLSLVSVHG